ncbi:MAG TPA: carboxyl transferase domain-containing protein, partial [Mycobacteriales bacterium]|nr:carboxyl transferase domain-containing protein [Mycobacteriales bacterium]
VHCKVSGVADLEVPDDEACIAAVRRYLSYFPSSNLVPPPLRETADPAGRRAEELYDEVPANPRRAYDVHRVIEAFVDDGEFFPMKPDWARNVVTGFAHLGGRSVGIVANQPKFLGGALDVNAADKAARFVWLCDAFSIPLVFLMDCPGFLVGSAVEKQGIIRHGAKMITAISEATVPKISVIVRKAYGAGLYAMAGPGFEPDACIALPTAMIAVMGPEAAVNAVYANKIAAIEDEAERVEFVRARREEYETDVDVVRLASELVVDAIVEPEDLRAELVRRYAALRAKDRSFSRRRHGVTPV